MGQKTSGTTTEKSSTVQTPDPVTDAWRQQVFNMGSQQVNQPYYQGQTVAPLSQQTQTGLGMLTAQAQQGAPNLQAANDASGRAISGWNPAMPFAANAAAGGLGGNAAMGALSQYGGATNPHLDGLWNTGARQVTDAVNGNFMKSGRFGNNGANTGALTQGLGDLYSSIYAPAYEAERNRGLTAAQTMGALSDSGQNRTLTGVGLFGDMYSQGMAQSLQAQSQLPSLYAYGQQPAAAMLQAGSIYDAQNQANINADMERYNAPWTRLQEYSAMMSGMPVFTNTDSTGQQKTRGTTFGIGWSPQGGLSLGGGG